MKKIFTLALALMGFASVSNAAKVDDIAPLKHSYVLVADNVTNNGTAGTAENSLFGDDHFLSVKALTAATNKGTVDLSNADGTIVTEEMAAKYGEYGAHLNSLRIKNGNDGIKLKLTDGSKLIVIADCNNTNRFPELAGEDGKTVVEGATTVYQVPVDYNGKTYNLSKLEITVQDGGTYTIIANNGQQIFLSYIIVEANEAPGTPSVKVGDQTFEGGLWFREVTAKANDVVEEGVDESIPTVLTYTTDGSAPTAASPKYTGPIKVYKNQTIKFQAFEDFGDGEPDDGCIADGADNEANVTFVFSAPSIKAEGATFTVETPYAEQNGKNYYQIGSADAVQGDGATVTESATVSAYTIISNGTYGEFKTATATKDVYNLTAITEKQTITVSGTAVVDEEATATAKADNASAKDVYKVDGGVINADKDFFFVKNPTFVPVIDEKYQAPAGQSAYIQMSNTNITFFVAEGDTVDVKVVTSLNSCKTLNPENDESVTTDRKNYVNVSGTPYGNDDVTAEGGNIIEFGLKGAEGGSYFTFQKYSGTGNILISSIEITPAENTGINTINAAKADNGAIHNLAGQKVDASYKGIVIKGGKKMIQK